MYIIKGINDDKDTCEKCGKTNLKKVVWLAEIDEDGNETGELIAVGTSCASYLMIGKKSRKESDAIWMRARAISCAKKWLKKYTVHQVADFIFQRFGFLTGTKNGTLIIGDFARIEQ